MKSPESQTPTLKIGIDPDTDKSGIALLDGENLILETLPFFPLMEKLRDHKARIKQVIVEAGWLVAKSNFHGEGNTRTAARKGKNVGANQEIGRKIVEGCAHYGIPYKIVAPLKKIWHGGKVPGKGRPNEKISHAEFVKHFNWQGGRTNQEQRDAALLVLDRPMCGIGYH